MTRAWLGRTALVAGALALAWMLVRVPDIPVATLRAKYASPASQFVEVLPGLTVHLRDEGKRGAPALILLHGSNSSLHTWEPWVARLGGSYRIVSLDLPAHGLTGPDPHDDYSAAASARIVAAVADRLGIGRFVLGGNSMGGGIAARFAVLHPERLNGLILVDSGGQPYPGARDMPLAFRVAGTPVLRDIVAGATPRWLIANGVRAAVSNQAVMTPAAIDRYWELLRYPGNRAATLERFSQGYGTVAPAELQRLAVPTLILWGREDHIIPVASAGYFAKHLPHSRTVIYDHIGHIPMEETPDASAAEVMRFMAALPRVTAPPPDSRASTPPSPG